MESKQIFRALVWAFIAFFVWQMIAIQIWGPPVPPTEQAALDEPAATNPDGTMPEATTSPDDALAGGSTPNQGAQTGTPGQAVVGAPAGTLMPFSADDDEQFELGGVEQAELSPYRMHVELSARGAAIREVTLSDYAAQVRSPERFSLLTSESENGPQPGSFSIEQITVDGRQVDLNDAVWHGRHTRDDEFDRVEFTLDVGKTADQPLLRLVQTYALPPQPADSDRFDMLLGIEVQNLDQAAHNVVITLRGPVGIPQLDPRMDGRAIVVAARPEDAIAINTEKFMNVAGQERAVVFTDAQGKKPAWWAAVDDQFFACILSAKRGTDDDQPPALFSEIVGTDLDGDKETHDDVTVLLITRPQSIAAGASQRINLDCYLGPKNRDAFLGADHPDYRDRGYYSLITRNYTWCTFGWLTDLMIWLLDGLYSVIPNYGVALIIMVLIVRALLHPITKKGQVNMLKMQKQMGKMAPKVEELKKKHGNDKMRLNEEMQKLYREEGINPAGQMLTCLPMFIQMPIWVALWTSLNNNIGMRHAPFMLWIRDLTAPDALIHLSGPIHIPLLGSMIGPVTSFNLLPILLGVAMYMQQKLMPKPAPPENQTTAQAEQAAMMQKMMPIMSIFFSLILYNAPSGLTLYIMSSTVFGTIEQLYIRKHIRELEEKGHFDPQRAKSGIRGPLWLRRHTEKLSQRWKEIQKQAEHAQQIRSSPRNRKGGGA